MFTNRCNGKTNNPIWLCGCGFLLRLGRGDEREKLIFHNHRFVYERTRESDMREKRETPKCVFAFLCVPFTKRKRHIIIWICSAYNLTDRFKGEYGFRSDSNTAHGWSSRLHIQPVLTPKAANTAAWSVAIHFKLWIGWYPCSVMFWCATQV